MADASLPPRLHTIVSGGQTGVDRGALDAAMQLGLTHGGWCPRGRRAEDGEIPPQYSLRETASSDYAQRTEQNVLDSDATLILCLGILTGGTALTERMARQHRRPCLVVDLTLAETSEATLAASIARWICENQVEVLNVAGPRESQSPGLQARTARLLTTAWAAP